MGHRVCVVLMHESKNEHARILINKYLKTFLHQVLASTWSRKDIRMSHSVECCIQKNLNGSEVLASWNELSKNPPPQLKVTFETGLCEGHGEAEDWLVKGLDPLFLRELSMTPECACSVNILVLFSRSQHSKYLQLTWQTLPSWAKAGNDTKYYVYEIENYNHFMHFVKDFCVYNSKMIWKRSKKPLVIYLSDNWKRKQILLTLTRICAF